MNNCKVKVIVFAILVCLTALFIPMAVMAATYQDVTVTATPAYISISNSQSTWTINGITGPGTINTDTTYYSNPQGDTTSPSSTVQSDEGYFPITDTSTVKINIIVDMEDFTGGDANMTNSETGSNGATSYGAYSYYEGMTYASKVIIKKYATGSDTLYAASTPGDADIDIGAEIKTQTTAWAGSSSSTATLRISAEAQ